jgi:4-hydroxythreonine-4-phosphate dehydrogenase
MTFEPDLLTPQIQQAMAITPGDPCGIGPEIIARA